LISREFGQGRNGEQREDGNKGERSQKLIFSPSNQNKQPGNEQEDPDRTVKCDEDSKSQNDKQRVRKPPLQIEEGQKQEWSGKGKSHRQRISKSAKSAERGKEEERLPAC